MIAGILIAALALISPEPATAASPVPGAALNGKAATVAASDADKMVCRLKITVGHHIGERQCMSKADWKTYDAATNTRFGNYDVGGGQGGCLPTQPCRSGPGMGGP